MRTETRARHGWSRQVGREPPPHASHARLEGGGRFLHYAPHGGSHLLLILCAFGVLVAAACGVLALLPKRAGNKRLDGHGGMMLSRGIMEVAYKLFEPLVTLLYRRASPPTW
jgi:hypothetical protein